MRTSMDAPIISTRNRCHSNILPAFHSSSMATYELRQTTPSNPHISVGSDYPDAKSVLSPTRLRHPELPSTIPKDTELESVNMAVSTYRSLSWILGFKEKYSLASCSYKCLNGSPRITHIYRYSLCLWRSPSWFLSRAQHDLESCSGKS